MTLELPVLERSTRQSHEDRPEPGHAGPAEHNDGGLLRLLLDEQQSLTAVERFNRDLVTYEAVAPPVQAKYYSKLLPATPPGPGQQYAFEVDLDRCSGCKACVVACHSLNGLDDRETWRDVGLLVGGTAHNPVMQHVTTACHHCLEPACMIACPVNAYEKDAVTGIVKHLDDQCFGCQYCTLACPYDVPKYHSGKGIVRKCDMCTDRLAAGEAPACVQACPHEAIAIRVVDVAQSRENAEADPFLPAAPEPSLTLPTTTYKTKRVYPRNMLPVDYYAVSPQHPHWPLILMLVLTQLSVGAFAVGMWLERALAPETYAAFQPAHALISLVFGLVALAASTLHLGRPQYAFRAVLGLTHSWLSREIVAFGAFAGAATMYAALAWFGGPDQLTHAAGYATIACGVCGIVCSAMIYVFTGRDFWGLGLTLTKFLLTAALLGAATTWLSILLAGSFGGAELLDLSREARPALMRLLLAAAGAKLAFELVFLRHLADRTNTPLKRSARLLIGPLSNSSIARFAAGLLGGVVMPLVLRSHLIGESAAAIDLPIVIIVSMTFLACMAGELLERYQYFAAVSAPRMPGGVRS